MKYKEQIGLWIAKYLYFRKATLKKNRTFYKKWIQPGDLCFDIGANIGGRSQTFLDLGARVLAVEPQSVFYKALQKQFAKHQNFKAIHGAAGDNAGNLTIKISSLFPMVSTLADDGWIDNIIKPSILNIRYDKEETVRVYTLDDLIERYGLPDFCKLDVEGFELTVLKGLSVKIPLISFEFFNYDMNNTLLCLARLEALGYQQFNWSKGEQQQLKLETWINAKLLVQHIEEQKDKKFSGDIYAR